MTKTLAVFPSDDVEAYISKGEIKKNYFNPNNLFDKIIIINPSAPKELDLKLLQFMCGEAEIELIFMGDYYPLKLLLMKRVVAKKLLAQLTEKKLSAIRSYGMLFNSYFAMCISKKLNVPFVLSLHDNYDGVRSIARKSGQYKNYLFYLLWGYLYEKKILKSTTRIIAVYGYAKKYALDMGISPKKISIIYNKVNPSIVNAKPGKKFSTFTAINVMRQNWMKNQEVQIRAVAQIPDMNLILIGNGPLHKDLQFLAKKLHCENRVKFIPSVMNTELGTYLKRAHVFMTSLRQGGVGIPVLEALACGLPVIHAKYFDEPNPDVLVENTMRVDNNFEAFRQALLKFKENKSLREMYKKKGIQFSKQINYSSMSEKEVHIYLSLIE